MIIHWNLGQTRELEDAVLAMGVFDGLHQGHQFLLEQACSDARERGLPAWAVTFACDPDELFKPTEQVRKLSSNNERLRRLQQSGVDGVLAIEFSLAVAALEPLQFLNRIIAQAFRPASLHIGSDFHFGTHASGGVNDLRNWAAARQCRINAHELLCEHGLPVTATRIRNLLASGRVAEAAGLLTRPYSLQATVVEGRHQGSLLGFPTANLAIAPQLAAVAHGVYAGTVKLEDGSLYPAAVSVGVPATFGDLPATTEATLLNYPPNAAPLYGQTVTLAYHQFLRPMQAFANVDELKAAIAKNVQQTRELLG
jgi:riboflavin kinase/FMN adenylyltransferase